MTQNGHTKAGSGHPGAASSLSDGLTVAKFGHPKALNGQMDRSGHQASSSGFPVALSRDQLALSGHLEAVSDQKRSGVAIQRPKVAI